ncbi:MAG: hypothetical protein HC932_00100 [Thermales bacterium]|nr:hypothetical protein [Thermales bacterium]
MKLLTREQKSNCIRRESGNSNIDKAIGEWAKIFGCDFPKTYSVSDNTRLYNSLQHEFPSSTEEFIENKDYSIDIINTSPYLTVNVIQNGFRPITLNSLIKSFFPLNSGARLDIKLNHSIADYDKILWKVRNYGGEAERDGQLRGQIESRPGQITEFTKYNGEHFVECYIIKNNTVIAKSNILIPIKK